MEFKQGNPDFHLSRHAIRQAPVPDSFASVLGIHYGDATGCSRL
jgi:hypothetical protein